MRTAGKAPLIVLPHGGPEPYDRYEFDWLAQYFASRGIVILQPQFRGSTGSGVTLRRAGKGQWGGAMSTDLDDGVQRLIDDGLVDPARVCMVGLSYGGYAALAAGAFSPFDYECLVAVSSISDLPRLLESERQLYGHDSAVVDYWQSRLDWKHCAPSRNSSTITCSADGRAGCSGKISLAIGLLRDVMFSSISVSE